MSATQIETALTTLEDVLVRERQLLFTGRAAETADLVKEKVSALEAFDSVLIGRTEAEVTGVQRERIDAVIAYARENSVHFQAIRNGLKNAISRLETLGDGAYVGAYGQGGTQTPFPKASGGYLKKI